MNVAEFDKKLNIYLFLALLVFALSFFAIESAKVKNNIYYIGFALPVAGLLATRFRTLSAERTAGFFLLLGFLLTSSLVDVILWRGEIVSQLKQSIYLLLFFFGLKFLHDQPGFEKLWGKWWGGSGLAFFVIALCGWVLNALERGKVRRFHMLGDADNPVYAALLIISCVVVFWLFVVEPMDRKGAVYYGMFSFFVLVVVTTALVFNARSVLAGVCLFFVAWFAMKKADLKLWLILLALSTVVLFWAGGAGILMKRGSGPRLEIWTEVVRRVVSDCGVTFGCGEDDYVFLGKYYHPHNSYLSILYRNGIVVSAFFLLWAINFLYSGFRHHSRWFLVSLIGWGGLLTTGSGVINSPKPFWIYFWLPVFLAMIEIEKSRRMKAISGGE